MRESAREYSINNGLQVIQDRQKEFEAQISNNSSSKNTEAAGDMLNLTMGQPELPAPQESHGPPDDSDEDDNPLEDMFQVPAETPVFRAPLPAKPWLDPWALMAEAKLK